ncbi:hypothetical protein NDU88_006708 [Pleurodeles waltl]|uniref:Uncharacterized protein n=1 Tax=Pleurodeles waltl TaxID=8319 RepID=A0AAV7X2F8_PLEWA|nr:hypothetical protein NDU88_006708 [Pleurodeles waltl]
MGHVALFQDPGTLGSFYTFYITRSPLHGKKLGPGRLQEKQREPESTAQKQKPPKELSPRSGCGAQARGSASCAPAAASSLSSSLSSGAPGAGWGRAAVRRGSSSQHPRRHLRLLPALLLLRPAVPPPALTGCGPWLSAGCSRWGAGRRGRCGGAGDRAGGRSDATTGAQSEPGCSCTEGCGRVRARSEQSRPGAHWHLRSGHAQKEGGEEGPGLLTQEEEPCQRVPDERGCGASG